MTLGYNVPSAAALARFEDMDTQLVVKNSFLEFSVKSPEMDDDCDKEHLFSPVPSTGCKSRRNRALSDTLIEYDAYSSPGRCSLMSMSTTATLTPSRSLDEFDETSSTASAATPTPTVQGMEEYGLPIPPPPPSDFVGSFSNTCQDAVSPMPCYTFNLPTLVNSHTPLMQNAADLYAQAASLKAQAQEAEDAAGLARAKARAPWRSSEGTCPERLDIPTTFAQDLAPMQPQQQQQQQQQQFVMYMPMNMPVFPMNMPMVYFAVPATETTGSENYQVGVAAADQQWQRQQAGQPLRQSLTESATAVEFTTLMFRNVPNSYSRDMLLELLDQEGFQGCYDFLYLPTDFLSLAGLGYAFVNFTSNENARKAKEHFHNFMRWSVKTQKVCEVSWGNPLQGLSAHIERYRNSPVMHESVPDRYKPIIFAQGVSTAFPGPTKRIRPPRMKRGGAPNTSFDFSRGGEEAR